MTAPTERDPEAFEHELLAWLDDPSAPDTANSVAWSKHLGTRGLLAPSWPEEHGGAGLDREQVRVLEAALRERGIRRAAGAAKAYATDVAGSITAEALQLHGRLHGGLHGGLGMTEEQDIGLYYKRARVAGTNWGDARFHYDRYARFSGF